MKTLNTNRQEERKIISKILLYIYPLLVVGDLTTTYISTPNLLQHEKNPVILFFQFGWTEVITLASLSVALIIFFVIKSDSSLMNFFIKKRKEKRYKIILGTFVHIVFLTHFVMTLWIIPNNYLWGIKINGTKYSLLQEIANNYVIHCNKLFINDFYFLLLILFFVALATILLVYRIKYLQKKHS